MKKQFLYSFLSLVLLFFIIGLNACEEGNTNAKTEGTLATNQALSDTSTITASTRDIKAIIAPRAHNCETPGSVLEDNIYWIEESNVLLGISADSTTTDTDFGESHRLFTAINTLDCSLLFKETLPVNRSPDFPWYLNTNTYENKNKILCMQGLEFVFCYDVATKKLLPRMKPKFYNNKATIDAQSGLPAGLAIWNRYVIGYALDQGAYVFDLNDKENPTPVAPSASYYSEEGGSFHNLFLLTNEKGMVQGLIPSLNEDQTGMTEHLLFTAPRNLNPTINKNVRDNRFLVLANNDGSKKTAIDMERRKVVELPSDIVGNSTQAILGWLKQNVIK